MRIKGIIIDYGGTIDTGGNHWFPVFRGVYAMHGIAVADDMLRKAYVYAEQQLERETALIGAADTFHDILWRKIDYQFEYFMQHSATVNADYKWRLVDTAYELAREKVQESAQVLKVLAQRYPLVLVSNFYGNLQAVINDFGITDCFRTIIESAAVGVRKPNPEIFSLGIQYLGLQPEEVAVVGDSYKNDMAPAQLLGCSTVWLKGTGWDAGEENHPEHKVDIVINQLSELQKIINLES